MAKRGRPVRGETRKNQIRIMLTDSEIAILREKSEYLGVSQAEILREGMPFGVKSLEDKMPLERKIEFWKKKHDENYDEYGDEYYEDYDEYDEYDGI